MSAWQSEQIRARKVCAANFSGVWLSSQLPLRPGDQTSAEAWKAPYSDSHKDSGKAHPVCERPGKEEAHATAGQMLHILEAGNLERLLVNKWYCQDMFAPEHWVDKVRLKSKWLPGDN